MLAKLNYGVNNTYTISGKLSKQNNNGQITNVIYDDNYRQRLVVLPNGEVERYEYDIFGNVIKQTNMYTKTINTYDNTNLLITSKYGANHLDGCLETSYVYSNSGLTPKTIYNESEEINLTFDEVKGLVTKIINHDETVEERVYDYLGNTQLLKLTSWNGSDNCFSSPL